MALRPAGCLTEPGIVCWSVAERTAWIFRTDAQRFNSTRPAKEFRRVSRPCRHRAAFRNRCSSLSMRTRPRPSGTSPWQEGSWC